MMEIFIMPITVTAIFLVMTVSSFSYGAIREKEEMKKLKNKLTELLEDPNR